MGGRVSGGLAATEESHWKVLDMSGPLGCQLEELDVTPLNSIDGHWGNREEKGYGLAKTPQGGYGSLPHPATSTSTPLSMVCCCFAEQMRRLMPSMTWLLESTSFSRGFLLRKIVGTVKPVQNMCQESWETATIPLAYPQPHLLPSLL